MGKGLGETGLKSYRFEGLSKQISMKMSSMMGAALFLVCSDCSTANIKLKFHRLQL